MVKKYMPTTYHMSVDVCGGKFLWDSSFLGMMEHMLGTNVVVKLVLVPIVSNDHWYLLAMDKW